ncbi:MAG: Gfo/Idh/MocA family oxidoreductase [Christensenella sp.]
MQKQDKKVNIGLIGLGERGCVLAEILLSMPNVVLSAVSDIYPERMRFICGMAEEKGHNPPLGYADYKQLLKDETIQAVIIATPVLQHVSMAICAMNAGKYAAIEACGAVTVQECWQLVHAAEKNDVDCMLLENCCYGRKELALLNMVKEKIFGEPVYFEGAYQHDLREEIVKGYMKNKQTRICNYIERNADIYPSHGLAPITKYLSMNYGNRMISLTSSSTKAVGLKNWISQNLETENYLSDVTFKLGDIVTTMIKWANGEGTLLIHDTTLPRPYSRGGVVQGTRGIWMESTDQVTEDGQPLEDPFCNLGSIHLENITPDLQYDDDEVHEVGLNTAWEPFEKYVKKYEHPLWVEIIDSGTVSAVNNSSCVNAGMDLLVVEAFVDSVARQSACPIDVYDTASILCVSALSEQSIQTGGMSVSVPDFTNGKWIERTPPKSKYML